MTDNELPDLVRWAESGRMGEVTIGSDWAYQRVCVEVVDASGTFAGPDGGQILETDSRGCVRLGPDWEYRQVKITVVEVADE
jgi:hypothetical protein